MTSETVEALHAVTSELKRVNAERESWLCAYEKAQEALPADLPDDAIAPEPLNVSQAEAEMIFTARRTAIEAKLKDLGWSKTTRVDSATPAGSG